MPFRKFGTPATVNGVTITAATANDDILIRSNEGTGGNTTELNVLRHSMQQVQKEAKEAKRAEEKRRAREKAAREKKRQPEDKDRKAPPKDKPGDK